MQDFGDWHCTKKRSMRISTMYFIIIIKYDYEFQYMQNHNEIIS